MGLIKYTKEFLYLFSGMTALFACAITFIIIMFAPFGLLYYFIDILNYHESIAIGVTIMVYCSYYVIARHFKLVEEI